ncbi:type II toxin-antitoxin system PemK/MazF family toxin [Candidatus Woesearchaeota archaeon]|nr:type II toxin-antitoxin system PemK/MazF family toxin [Candidatus Woesearchaeota archaeon]
MEKLVKGDIVVVPFPFSDLSASKKRPALVIASLTGNDLILCQITSKAKFDGYSISLAGADFEKGGLNVPSRIRPNRLFTADNSIILYKAGSLRQGKINEVEEALVRIIRG